jgi:hypothetical protein
MKIYQLYVIATFMAASLGCTKGTPDFSTLGSDSVPQPKFSGATETSLTATSPSQIFSISGDCDTNIRDITGTAVGTATAFSTLTAMSTSGVTVNCSSTGTFSFTLKSLTDLGYTPVDGTTYDIQLRAITSGGTSNPSTIHIVYSSSGGASPNRILITSGGTESSSGERISSGGGHFKAQIRVSNRINAYSSASTQDAMTLKTGGAYQMRSGYAAQGN